MFRQVKKCFSPKKSRGTKRIQTFINTNQNDCGDDNIDIGEYIDSTPPLTPPTMITNKLGDELTEVRRHSCACLTGK